MQALSIDELHAHPEALSVAAHAGRPALVTDQGQPLFLTVPCDDTLLRAGVHIALAVGLFRSGELSAGKAAELARMPHPAFLGLVSRLGIPVVDDPPEDLEAEVANAPRYPAANPESPGMKNATAADDACDDPAVTQVPAPVRTKQ